jgi:hypothetical protein
LNIVVAVPLNDDDVLTLMGMAYTSASSSNINLISAYMMSKDTGGQQSRLASLIWSL